MSRYIDLSVTVDDATLSPPSTNLRLQITPHRRGPGFWQVSSVHQSLHTGLKKVTLVLIARGTGGGRGRRCESPRRSLRSD